jgi:hypothetical protein
MFLAWAGFRETGTGCGWVRLGARATVVFRLAPVGDRGAAAGRTTILVDVNLSPRWVPSFERHGIVAIYWTDVAPMDATDNAIMAFAAAHGDVLMTDDLGLAAKIAASGLAAPGVHQFLRAFAAELDPGALVTVTNERGRVQGN